MRYYLVAYVYGGKVVIATSVRRPDCPHQVLAFWDEKQKVE
jgi:hypothetical protein